MGAAYAASLQAFLATDPSSVLGQLTSGSARAGWDPRRTQIAAWEQTLALLRRASEDVLALPGAADWGIVLEYDIPLRQKRPDVVLIAKDIILVVEAKTGASTHTLADQRQAEAYCLDLRDFHAESAGRILVPVLVACSCTRRSALPAPRDDAVQTVVLACASDLAVLLREAYQLHSDPSAAPISVDDWVRAAYRPVPGILQAAEALYAGHTVREIARAYAGNLTETADCLMEAIRRARDARRKTICFVTGVPGSGKTLAGLNLVHSPELSTRAEGIATFLSGNGPLVRVMREALARDSSARDGIPVVEARRRVATFIQNVHDFMRLYTGSAPTRAPHHRVAVFDEAQRAWDAQQAARKFGRPSSEPAAMLDILNRHPDWSVIVALVGGGQEIHTGEAGLAEWGRALLDTARDWRVLVSPEALAGGESTAGSALFEGATPADIEVMTDAALHLNVAVRSWRAEVMTEWVNAVLAGDQRRAKGLSSHLGDFPLVLTRSLGRAKMWLREHTRGDRRCGLLTSSGGLRLRPYGIEVSSGFTRGYDFAAWWLAAEGDVRSSHQLEVAATEFECQGLELDWAGVCWANDLTWDVPGSCWRHRRFAGARWGAVRDVGAQAYLVNKYRVLLTRARDGLVVWVPPGQPDDQTLQPAEFDATADYLVSCGACELL